MISSSAKATISGQSSELTIAKVLRWRCRVRFFVPGIIIQPIVQLGSVSPRHLFVQFDKSVDLLAERDVILDRNLAGLLGALPSGALMHGLEF